MCCFRMISPSILEFMLCPCIMVGFRDVKLDQHPSQSAMSCCCAFLPIIALSSNVCWQQSGLLLHQPRLPATMYVGWYTKQPCGCAVHAVCSNATACDHHSSSNACLLRFLTTSTKAETHCLLCHAIRCPASCAPCGRLLMWSGA